jgi:hypothetical protein
VEKENRPFRSPEIPAVFLPGQSTARLALEVSPWLALDVMARRALRGNEAAPSAQQANAGEAGWTEEDIQCARSVLGEQLIGWLARFARQCAGREEGSQLHLVQSDGQFAGEFEKPLARHLQAAPSQPRYHEFMRELAGDFRRWVASRPAELAALGLSDRGSDGVLLTCRTQAPVLTPLPD